MRKKGISILNLLTIIMLSGCVFQDSDNAIEPPEGDPYIIGKITQMKEDSGHTILVEENTEIHEPSEPEGNKIWFSIGSQTDILILQDNKSLSEADAETLKVGQKVKGWTTGVISESYPAKSGAKRIIVVK